MLGSNVWLQRRGVCAGVAMGVDTLRSNTGTASSPGLNSILLVRSAIHNGTTTDEVIDYIVQAKRGCPFLYPIADASGSFAVVEAGAYNASSTVADPTSSILPQLLPFLPSYAYTQEYSKPDYRNGVYVRTVCLLTPLQIIPAGGQRVLLSEVFLFEVISSFVHILAVPISHNANMRSCVVAAARLHYTSRVSCIQSSIV